MIDNENNQEFQDANLEEFDDFPDYANQENKMLNQQAREKTINLNQLKKNLSDNEERTKVLQDHLKKVEVELKNTQSLLTKKNEEIQSEKHMLHLTRRQCERTEAQVAKLRKTKVELQDRLNSIQAETFGGNEKLDQFKLEMNWNQDELEQWALASRQKEEDNLTLEKQRRQDDIKIKEVTLTIERLTVENNRKTAEIDKEITETQSTQIELDSVAEELRNAHKDRHELQEQWQRACNINLKKQNEMNDLKDGLFETQRRKREKEAEYKQKVQELKNIVKKNGDTDNRVKQQEKENSLLRDNVKQKELGKTNEEAEVTVVMNGLGALADQYQSALERYRLESDKLDQLKKKAEQKDIEIRNCERQVQKLSEELQGQEKSVKEQSDEQEKKQKELQEKRMHMENLKANIVERQKNIQEVEENLKLLDAEIKRMQGFQNSNKQTKKNLEAQIRRQEEIIQEKEFQIQKMEGRVAKQKGDMSEEEKKLKEREVVDVTEELDRYLKSNAVVDKSLRGIKEESKKIEVARTSIEKETEGQKTAIDEIDLHIELASKDLDSRYKEREELLVETDLLKMELRRIKEKLDGQVDTVQALQNRKTQLMLSTEEREREVKVHKDVLIAEARRIEDEIHKVKKEYSERLQNIKNLKVKQDTLTKKNKLAKTGDDEEDDGEVKSQVYYVIKAAQKREELQRYGDELDAKIRKAEREIKALTRTLEHLKSRNWNQRNQFVDPDKRNKNDDKKKQWEEQVREAGKEKARLEKKLKGLSEEKNIRLEQLEQLKNDGTNMKNRLIEVNSVLEEKDQEIEVMRNDLGLVQQECTEKEQQLTNNNIGFSHSKLKQAEIQLLQDQFLRTVITLGSDYQDFIEEVSNKLRENDIELPLVE